MRRARRAPHRRPRRRRRAEQRARRRRRRRRAADRARRDAHLPARRRGAARGRGSSTPTPRRAGTRDLLAPLGGLYATLAGLIDTPGLRGAAAALVPRDDGASLVIRRIADSDARVPVFRPTLQDAAPADTLTYVASADLGPGARAVPAARRAGGRRRADAGRRALHRAQPARPRVRDGRRSRPRRGGHDAPEPDRGPGAGARGDDRDRARPHDARRARPAPRPGRTSLPAACAPARSRTRRAARCPGRSTGTP